MFCRACLLLGFSLPAAFGQTPDASKQPGMAVGMKAPSFKLKDQNGEERSLEEFLKKGKVALVFYRSAKW
jgi:hypothetical protein